MLSPTIQADIDVLCQAEIKLDNFVVFFVGSVDENQTAELSEEGDFPTFTLYNEMRTGTLPKILFVLTLFDAM